MIEVSAIGCAQREVIITPAAGWQGFEFQMAEVRQQVSVARFQQSAIVVKDREAGIDATGCFRRTPEIFQQGASCETQTVLFLFRIISLSCHIPHAVRTAALPLRNDIKEHAVGIREKLIGLLDQAAEIIQIRGIEAELFETGLQG